MPGNSASPPRVRRSCLVSSAWAWPISLFRSHRLDAALIPHPDPQVVYISNKIVTEVTITGALPRRPSPGRGRSPEEIPNHGSPARRKIVSRLRVSSYVARLRYRLLIGD